MTAPGRRRQHRHMVAVSRVAPVRRLGRQVRAREAGVTLQHRAVQGQVLREGRQGVMTARDIESLLRAEGKQGLIRIKRRISTRGWATCRSRSLSFPLFSPSPPLPHPPPHSSMCLLKRVLLSWERARA
jgi:hypothetical protein